MILKPVSVVLNNVLEKDAMYLPLTQEAENKLLALIPDQDSMYLTLQDNLHTEYVLVQNQCGTLVVMERGVDSDIYKFPRGTCVFFECSLPVIKWLICNYDCCADGECDCEPVALQNSSLPVALTGMEWEGRLKYTGSLPINFKVTGPDWLSASYQGDLVVMSGVPDAKGSYGVSVSAVNCQGAESQLDTFTITVQDL